MTTIQTLFSHYMALNAAAVVIVLCLYQFRKLIDKPNMEEFENENL